MNRLGGWGVAAAALLLAGAAQPARSGELAKEVVGTWTIVSAVVGEGQSKVDVWGPEPKGTMILADNGRFTVVLMRGSRPKFASNNRESGTAEENAAAMKGSIGYFGSYQVADDGTMTVHIDGATYPNWDGIEQKRKVSVKGDELQIVNNAPSGNQGTAVLMWKRAK